MGKKPRGKGAANGSAKKTEPKKKRSSAPAKPSAVVLSDQDRQALLFKHARTIKPLLAEKKEAADAVTKAFELAKSEGITRKDIELKILLESGEGIEKAKVEAERMQRVVRWMGLGKQIEMFADHETVAQRHYEDGRRAALDDRPASPPDHLSQKNAQTWLQGHESGRTTLNTQRIQNGFRVPDQGEEATGDMLPIGGAAAAATAHLGTEPPTHTMHG